MDKRYIVALEIGSSKIKGLVGAVDDLGTINIIACEETRLNNCVRYGKIQNVQEVSARVNDIIRKLEHHPRIAPRKVTEVFIGLGGRSFATIPASAQATFPAAIQITDDHIERLKREAGFSLVSDKEALAMIPKRFFVDNIKAEKAVGTVGSRLRGEFSAVVYSAVNRRNLEMIKFDSGERQIARHYVLRPIVEAEIALSSSEKQLGVALVDFGAETTTIVVYKDDALQHIVTLPMGSRNITRDLMSGMSMTEERAELAKTTEGAAVPDANDTPDPVRAEINGYIQARAGEIMANVLHQLDVAGFKTADLPAGLVITGGGARLRNFARLVEQQSKMKVRPAVLEGSARFRGLDIDRSSNIDVLAIARYAADSSQTDCLSAPAPAPVADDSSDATDTTNVTYDERRPRYNDPYADAHTERPLARRRYVDDEDLLNDDPDDDDETDPRDSGDLRTRVRGTSTRDRRPVREPDYDDRAGDDVDETLDDNYTDDSGDETYPGGADPERQNIFSKLRKKMSDFWMRSPDIGDDIDEPTR